VSAILYLIVPCFNEEEIISKSMEKLESKMYQLIKMNTIDSKSKVILINDGSTDNTYNIISEKHNNNHMFSCINFSRNFGHQNAVMAGYIFANNKCDIAISIDADLQQDINAIDQFIQKYYEGYDVVYGVRNTRDTDGLFKKASSQAFYRLMQAFDCEIIPNHADYRLLSNRVLTTLSDYNESNIFLRGLIPTLGYNSCIVNFDVFEREAGSSKYSLKKMINLAIDGITSHSIRPMHLIFSIGWFFLLIAIINLLYTLIVFLKGDTVPGWTTIVVSIWLLSGIQLIALGSVGEYVGKNYLETKKETTVYYRKY
jgi:glycosyltransferase involved in cell wall biosynthesis